MILQINACTKTSKYCIFTDLADVSDGEIIDDEVGGSAEVAQAVEAAMVAARRQVQENPPRDDDIVVLELSLIHI